MKSSRILFVFLLIPLLAIVGCEGDQGPAGPPGEDGQDGQTPTGGDLTCAECHNDTNIISGKLIQWEESAHGMGEAYVRGTSRSCAGCHSGNAFAERIESGTPPDELTEGDMDPTRQDCRACHMIHDTYTSADWAVRGTDAVDFYAVDGATYDGGKGNLCANCHQPRRVFPGPGTDGIVRGITTHWGPHHGGQGSMILGVAGAGDVTGAPSPHYLVNDSCVHCHMGAGREHTFEPDTDACEPCHGELPDFDYNGVQTTVQAKIDALGDRLVELGLIDENSPDGHPAVTEAAEDEAIALWNWLYIAHEDGSLGVHNSAYTNALLDLSISLVAPPAPSAR